MAFSGLIWFVVMLLPLVFLQRLLHREIQSVLLLVTRNIHGTIRLFSLLFFPGIFLHELSHWVMAKALQVKTGRVSLLPRTMADGRLQMGYVETASTDIFRDSLVGLAPLIAGTLFVAFAGIYKMQVYTLWNVLQDGHLNLFWMGLGLLPSMKNFYWWFYLTFAVSSTMMPSEADRHAWLPFGLWAATLISLAVFSGAGEWMVANLAPLLDEFLYSVALLFGLSNAVHVLLLFPFYLFHRILAYITRSDVE